MQCQRGYIVEASAREMVAVSEPTNLFSLPVNIIGGTKTHINLKTKTLSQ